MQRSEADNKYKWNLTDIYKTEAEFYKDLEFLEKNCEKFTLFKGKLNNFDEIFDFFSFNNKFNEMFMKAYSYVFLHHDIELNNKLYIELLERINMLIANVSMTTAFVDPELLTLSDEFLNSLLADKKFNNYEYQIKNIINNRKFILSEKEEIALSTASKYANGFNELYEALTQSDFKFEPVEVDDKKEELTQSSYSKFIENKNRDVRQHAYKNLYSVFCQFSKTLSYNYINFVKFVSSEIDIRKAKSVFNYRFNNEKIPEKILDVLNYNVEKNISLEHKYFELLKESLNLQNMQFYDVYQTLAPEFNKKWSVEEQKDIVSRALKPLSNEYIDILHTAFNNNWIDYYPDKDKKSGGYMAGVYGVHPFVFLDDTGSYDSLSTLAHELGHAAHTYYANSNQPYSKHDYSTFIAEIASTVNEIILVKYMIKNSETDEEKLFYLSHYLQGFKSTIFRQAMFSEFENFAYTKVENNKILSEDILNNEYKHLLEKHFGNIVNIDDYIIHEWQRIPHFYYPYYVFQYATSYIAAVYIANSIINGNKEVLNNYIKILSKGGDGYPIEILKEFDIDMLDNSVYDLAFNDMKQCLFQVEKILKK